MKSFKAFTSYYTDSYKLSHGDMLADNTKEVYGTWVPRSLKYAPKGINRIISVGQQIIVRWLYSEWEENFFNQSFEEAEQFVKDVSNHLDQPYNGQRFYDLHKLGYLPIRIKSLPEGISTLPNIPHMTFINTHPKFAWLTLYLETVISSLAWKTPTVCTIQKQFNNNSKYWIEKTDKANMWFLDYCNHDFSARGLDPMSMYLTGLGHAFVSKGSDTLLTIPAARHYYDLSKNEVPIYSVNASEHSVSCTKIFTVGEQKMISDWLQKFPNGILSIVADTFDLWKLITEYLLANKEAIIARDGKLVIRPDSGDPVEIICGLNTNDMLKDVVTQGPEVKGVIELLWDIFGGTINEQGYKVLDPHIGAIYGDSITIDRQVQIYERLASKGFAATNIVFGIGSYSYQTISRDTLGYAAKATWFSVEKNKYMSEYDNKYVTETEYYNIYKNPITDDGTKKSLQGLLKVYIDESGEYQCKQNCSLEEEKEGELQIIFENGVLCNSTSFNEVRKKINLL